MKQIGKIKVLFIAGFGPIVREKTASQNLYGQNLGIKFKEENDGYLHTETLKGAKTFALWPLWQAAQSSSQMIPGLTRFLSRKLGLNLMSIVSKKRQRSLSLGAIECSSKTKKNRGARLSADSFRPRAC
jgi:hypothetical protein